MTAYSAEYALMDRVRNTFRVGDIVVVIGGTRGATYYPPAPGQSTGSYVPMDYSLHRIKKFPSEQELAYLSAIGRTGYYVVLEYSASHDVLLEIREILRIVGRAPVITFAAAR